VRSHTGALAGSDELFDAVCRDEGIVRVAEPEDLLQVARVLCAERPARGRRVLVYTLSGGGAAVLADELCAQSLGVPGLSKTTARACDALGEAFIRAANPFDVGSSVFSNPNAAAQALKIAAADPNIDAVAWIGVGAPRDERSNLLLGAALDALAACGKPAVVLPFSGTAVEPGFARAHELGIPVARSARSAALLLRYSLHAAPSSAAAVESAAAHAGAARVIDAATVMNEAQARQELARAGVPMLSAAFAADLPALRAAAAGATYPAVLKGIASGVAHKTEAGLVALRLANADAVCAAAAVMARRHAGALDGYTLEPMLEGGIETVIGVRIDPQFGAMLMFGLGGIAVELFRDVSFTQCPCTPESARRLIEGTRAWTLLRGFRGSPPADLDALMSALMKLSEYAAAHAGQLLEMEINPLIVLPRGRGAYGVDALIVKRPPMAR
jgi:acyl-CoA synthetase (NDP forming)